ncbi:hypothetical protein PRBEI_2001857800 [Prionailurus iriomotensis]
MVECLVEYEESRGSLGNERMRSAQLQGGNIAEEMDRESRRFKIVHLLKGCLLRTRILGDCCIDTWNPGFSKTKVDITVPHLNSNSVLLDIEPTLNAFDGIQYMFSFEVAKKLQVASLPGTGKACGGSLQN